MLAGVDLGQSYQCNENEWWSDLLQRCLPNAPQSEPVVPDPICDPGWTNDGGACVCDGTVDPKTGHCNSAAPQLPPGFVAPGAVPVVVAAWDLDAKPYARYTLQWGDTYVGLSATYLGDGARWREIWNLNRQQHPSPDHIYVSQVINMPDEAAEKLRRWLKGGKKGKPGDLPAEPTPSEKVKGALPWVVAAAVAAGGIYYLSS